MKILKKLSLALVTLLLLFSFTTPKEEYVGKWKGQDKSDIGFLTLTDDGYAIFEINGQIIGGRSYMQQGINVYMRYIVNTGISPAGIDFIIYTKSDNVELARMKGIIEMDSSDELHLALTFGSGSSRPSDFSKDNIIFNRVK